MYQEYDKIALILALRRVICRIALAMISQGTALLAAALRMNSRYAARRSPHCIYHFARRQRL